MSYLFISMMLISRKKCLDKTDRNFPIIVLFTCIFTAMMTELSSGPRDLLRTKRVNVKLHNLKEK